MILDVGRGPFGLSVDVAIEGSSVMSAAQGQLTATFQWLTLSARWRWAWPRVSLDAGLGVRGSRLTAASSGFTRTEAVTLYSVGPAVSGTLWVRVLGPLELLFRASAALRLPGDQLVISQGPTFAVGEGQLAAVLGLAVAWP